MSVLRSVKNKLQNVQDDLKASFRSLSVHADVTNKKIDGRILSALVNYDVGAELLDKFQSHWAEIHQNTEENAKRAILVDKEIGTLTLQCEKQSLNYQQLSTELAHVQFISQDIQNLHGSLVNLESSFRKLEIELEELDDICEELEFRNNCKVHKELLRSWEESRVKEMQELKVKMSQEHVKKVQAFEQQRWEKLCTKQEALQEAFMHDMEEYRKLGKLSRSPSTCSDHHVDVGDIEVCTDDKSELDEFLEIDNEVNEALEFGTIDIEENENIDVQVDEDITSESALAMKYELSVEEKKAESEC